VVIKLPKLRPNSILSVMQRGLSFLRNSQLPSGNFRTIQSRSIILEKGRYRRSPFITTFVLYSLTSLQPLFETDDLIERGIEYLLSECESPGIWRFFGRGSHMLPDLDDTCCALVILKKFQMSGIDFSYASQHMLQFRDHSGVFYTWMNLPPDNNDVDPVVNSNALFFYSLIDKDLQDVKNYLINIIQEIALNGTSFRSSYYLSLSSLLYTISRAITFQKAMMPGSSDTIELSVKKLLSEVPKNNDVLDTALILSASLNLGMIDKHAKVRLVSILRQQNLDGSWNAIPFFKEGQGIDIYYGSPELTTALCLEALAKSYSCFFSR